MAIKGQPKQFFREWRKFRGLNQQQAADRIEVEQPTISRLESGKIEFNQETLDRLALAYGCDPADLLSINPLDPDPLKVIYSELKKAPPEVQARALAVIQTLLKAG